MSKKIIAWAGFLKAYYPVFFFACGGIAKPKNHILVKEAERMGQKCIYRKVEIKILK